MDFADKRVLPREMAREYLHMGARAIMQMWRDLEKAEERQPALSARE
jgi:hypothetical protein